MPRTKQVKKPSNKELEKEKLLKLCREKEIEILAAIDDEDTKLANLEAETEMLVNMMRSEMAPYLNVTLADLDAMSISTTLSVTNSMKKRGRPMMKRSISDTAINDSNAVLQYTSKSGTISSDSGNSSSRSTSRSALRAGSSSRPMAKSNRRSRSLSRNEKNGNFGNARSTMRTPLIPRQQIMTPITPKMKNYDSHPAVMRRPMQNEIAVSLQGSPLMVNAIMTDGISANIPLADGRVIALQPQNMRFSDIADISFAPQSICDIQQLRDNLTKLCESLQQPSSKIYKK